MTKKAKQNIQRVKIVYGCAEKIRAAVKFYFSTFTYKKQYIVNVTKNAHGYIFAPVHIIFLT